jgi:hypothetical protein
MLTRDPGRFLRAFRDLSESPTRAATARAVFLVSPDGFDLASESASDNAYMHMHERVDVARALGQHAALVRALREDVPVVTFPGDAHTPDAVFPNNVFGTAPGTLVVGRMRHPVRRREAGREDIRRFFADILGYHARDLSTRENLTAELTGALVIDRLRGVGYCGLSERCDAAGAQAMHDAFGLNLTLCFDLAPGEYHTNVLLACLAGRAVMLAADGFADPAVPAAIAEAYAGRVVSLTPAQKRRYAGNAITLHPSRVWLSVNGAASLTGAQRDDLTRWGFGIGTVALDEIEKSGGSLRCCVAEIF